MSSGDPELHLVVGEVSLRHLVGGDQALRPAGGGHLQQGGGLTAHGMQRGEEDGEEEQQQIKSTFSV